MSHVRMSMVDNVSASSVAQPLNFAQNQKLSRSSLLKLYYQLTKPGIIYGNAITVVAGFFLASRGQIDFWRLISTLIGVSSVIAAACVCNNYIDRSIDARMERTKKRALVDGLITTRSALWYAAVLTVTGFTTLALFTNRLTASVGLIGMIFYIVLYGMAKRKTIYGTEVGSVSGSMPIVAGYTAVTGHFDITALLLFLVLTLANAAFLRHRYVPG